MQSKYAQGYQDALSEVYEKWASEGSDAAFEYIIANLEPLSRPASTPTGRTDMPTEMDLTTLRRWIEVEAYAQKRRITYFQAVDELVNHGLSHTHEE